MGPRRWCGGGGRGHPARRGLRRAGCSPKTERERDDPDDEQDGGDGEGRRDTRR